MTTAKRGYLNEDYKLFHIYDKRSMDFDSHSHDFHKLIICLSGSANYTIEGKRREKSRTKKAPNVERNAGDDTKGKK